MVWNICYSILRVNSRGISIASSAWSLHNTMLYEFYSVPKGDRLRSPNRKRKRPWKTYWVLHRKGLSYTKFQITEPAKGTPTERLGRRRASSTAGCAKGGTWPQAHPTFRQGKTRVSPKEVTSCRRRGLLLGRGPLRVDTSGTFLSTIAL